MLLTTLLYLNLEATLDTNFDVEERLRNYALWLLGRQDYSEKDLRTKFANLIKKKEYVIEGNKIDNIIDYLQESGYQSDTEYADSIITSLSSAFRGPMKLRQKFMEKGLDLSILENNTSIDWFELCKEYYLKKYKTEAVDFKDQSKRFRHLAGRGYLPDHINYAFEHKIDQ